MERRFHPLSTIEEEEDCSGLRRASLQLAKQRCAIGGSNVQWLVTLKKKKKNLLQTSQILPSSFLLHAPPRMQSHYISVSEFSNEEAEMLRLSSCHLHLCASSSFFKKWCYHWLNSRKQTGYLWSSNKTNCGEKKKSWDHFQTVAFFWCKTLEDFIFWHQKQKSWAQEAELWYCTLSYCDNNWSIFLNPRPN